MEKQAIITVRFSPRPNANQCMSCERQEARCRAFCQQKGYTVARVLYDRKITGGTLDRPGLQEALASLKAGMVLIADSSDRLARDMLTNLLIRHQVSEAGATVEFADGSPADTTPEGELFANILAAFAAYERARIRRNTRRGLARKKANGDWLGRVPIGWKRDPENPKRLAKCKQEQKAIAHARLLSKGSCSSKQIAAFLTREYGPCRGKPWSARTVRKLLSRSASA